MIKFTQTPWKTGFLEQRRNMILAALAVIMMIMSFISIVVVSQAKAEKVSQGSCQNFIVVGDSNSLGDKNAGLEDKLNEQGAKSVEFEGKSGSKTKDIPSQLKGKKLDGKCVIVESGVADNPKDKAQALKEIKKVLGASGSAKRVFWVTPTTKGNKNTKEFNDALKELSKDNDKLSVVDIKNLSGDGGNFANNGISMTSNGYKKRVNIISESISQSSQGSNDPTSISQNSSTPSSSSNGGSNSGGESNSGSNSNSGGSGNSDSGTPVNVDNGQGSKGDEKKNPCDEKDCFRGDPSKISPRAMADSLGKLTSYQDATRYLAIERWSGLDVPTREMTALDPTSLVGAFSSNAIKTFLGFGRGVAKGAYTITSFAFTSSITSIMTRIGDKLFGKLLGDGLLNEQSSNAGTTGVLISSLMTIIIAFSIFRAFSTETQADFKQRAVTAISAIIKGALTIMIVLFIAAQSKKNGISEQEQYRQAAQTIQNDQDGTPEIGSNALSNNSGHNNPDIGNHDIDNPKSWHAMSLGWIISMTYHYGQMVAGAVANIARVFLITPIDSLTKVVTEAAPMSGGEANECDRYVDAMHYAFGHTAAVQNHADKSTVLLTLDNLFVRSFFNTYKLVYGGNTGSAGRAWCYQLEKQNGTVAPEWIMLARTAGLYREGIGTGNLIGNNPGVYADGSHSSVSFNAATKNGLSPFDGFLVKANGDWVSGKPEDNFPTRAMAYMGRAGGDTGAAEAKYYFSGCTWKPGGNGKISDEWKNVRGMGGTGGSNKDKGDDYNTTDIKDKATSKDAAEGDKIISSAVPSFNIYMDWAKKEQGDSKTHEYLSDMDCWHPQIFAIGDGEGSSKFGFGAEDSEPAKRWNFAPVPAKNMVEEGKSRIKDIASSTANALSLGLVGKSGGEQEKDKDQENPLQKFGSSMNDRGYMPAFEFWNFTNGYNAMRGILPSLLAAVLSACLSALIILAAFPALLVNVILSILFVLIPFGVAMSLLMMALRAGRK